MSYFAIGAVIVGAGATVYGAVQTNKAARQAAQVDTATAQFNAQYDESLAKQLDFDTIQNVRTMRADAASYISRQHASYAAAGVLANAGSPLHAQITNAGRLEQQIQQEYVNSQQKQKSYYEQAKAGVAMGEARAYSDRVSGKLALINGAAKASSSLFGAYNAGVFS